MALGDRGNQKKAYDNTYYSRLGFRDYSYNSGKRLSISYKSGMMVLTISKDNGTGFESEDIISVYITVTKAKIFYNQIKLFFDKFMEGTIDVSEAFGINTGMGDVQTIAAVKVNENTRLALVIAKVDQSGAINLSEEYIFNAEDFNYGLNFSDISDSVKFSKEKYANLELEQLMETLKSFYENMNGAVGYSTIDLGRYDYRSMINKFNPVYNKLGIETNPAGNSGQNRSSYSSGFFGGSNNNGNSRPSGRSNHSDFEDVAAGFYDEEE